ncbi:pyocin knob domain-containing protein [Paenibacillus hubeiensis]|uniref:pyocin knob domain-containing protein n=1 Tax=Paenibacillus hubeiensis TaxID=3077330 RepID=UPI0031BA2A59
MKLPLPLGNENVTRESINAIFEKIDAGVATQEDLEMLREAVNKMDIPDASLTQKGKVQLSSKTNGTSETLAATEKAVKAAVDSAIPRMIPDTRNVPTKPSDYSKSVAYSFKTGPVAGLPAEQYVVIHGFKGWNDDSGGVTHEYASGGTTGQMYHRTGTSANDTWGPWMQIIDNGVPWQKRMLTNDDGASLNISNGDANTLTRHGFYVGENIANAPRTGAGEWWYIRVSAMNVNLWVKQEAINLFSNTYQMRTGSDAGNGTINWSPWTQDLFTSVSNGKASVAAAITDKGVSASGSESFASLTSKIREIQQDRSGSMKLSFTSPTYTGTYYDGGAAPSSKELIIADFPSDIKMISFFSDGFYFRNAASAMNNLTTASPFSNFASGYSRNGCTMSLVLRDSNKVSNNIYSVTGYSNSNTNGNDGYINWLISFQLDLVSGKGTVLSTNGAVSSVSDLTRPIGTNSTPLQLVLVVTYWATPGYHYVSTSNMSLSGNLFYR